jgi:hypothetical protein
MSPSIATFFELYAELPHLCREFIVRFLFPAYVCGNDELTADFCVVQDTVNVWMRCRVQQRRAQPANATVTEVFVRYDNWAAQYDEWVAVGGARYVPWVEPSALAQRYFREDEWGVKLVDIEHWRDIYRRHFGVKVVKQ